MKELKAYKTMFRFLDERYQQLPSDALGALLGSMSLDLWADGSPADPGIEAEWARAVDAVEQEEAVALGSEQSVVLRKAS